SFSQLILPSSPAPFKAGLTLHQFFSAFMHAHRKDTISAAKEFVVPLACTVMEPLQKSDK
ncbi:MAG: hypothetical protein JXR76_01065, partial [Deltaproteobacteria bacterium]|nr:hypothetical protein [Deltaproteobacteria bacterium]